MLILVRTLSTGTWNVSSTIFRRAIYFLQLTWKHFANQCSHVGPKCATMELRRQREWTWSVLFVAQYIFCVAETKQADLLAVQSAGLTAGVAAGCLAALLLSWTLTIMIAVLSTHGGSLGQSAAARLHCVWCNALMSTSVVAALLLIGTVTVIRAEFSTQPWTPAPARTHSWLGC